MADTLRSWKNTKQLQEAITAGKVCGHCLHHKDDHRLVNFADGALVGKSLLLCPTVPTFVDAREMEGAVMKVEFR